MEKRDLTRLLGWPGYRVYKYEVDEAAKTLKLWVRRKPIHRGFECSGCGRRVHAVVAAWEREVADLDCFEFRVTVVVEVHRLNCVECGPKVEKLEQVPSKAPYTKRFEDRVGQACESAAARRVARQFGLPESTVRAIDLRYLERWAAKRRKAPLKQLGVDEIYMGEKIQFVTVASNLETGEPLWFGRERKRETLDEFFRTQLRSSQRRNIQAACVDMWQPFTASIMEWAPQCKIVYDKFHIMKHANAAVNEVRRAEFFRQGGRAREVVKGKNWLLFDALGQPGEQEETVAQRALQTQSPDNEGLSVKGSAAASLGLQVRGRRGALPERMGGSTSVATLAGLSEAGQHAGGSSGRDSQLLPHQSTVWRGGRHQLQYPYADQPRARI